MSVPKLNVPSLSVPRLNVPHLQVPRLKVPTLDGYKTDAPGKYKKPERRHAKDLGDIILGNPITGTRQLRETLIDNNAAGLIYVPILNRIAGTLFMFEERFGDPIREGDLTTAFINSLETLGSSLDIVANPIKSLMPWAGGGSTTDLYKSMGWIDDAYRETYQWNTGDWVLDVIGEFASDPINWITFGSKGLLKGASSSLDEATETVLKSKTGKLLIGASDDAIKDAAYVHNFAQEVAASAADDTDEIVSKLMMRANSNRNQLMDKISKCTNPTLKKKMQALLSDMNLVMANDFKGNLTDMVDELRMSSGFRYYKAIKSVEEFGTKLDNDLINLSFAMAPMFGGTKLALKYAIKPTFKALRSSYIDKLNKLTKSKAMPNSIHTVYKELLDDLPRRSYLLHKDTYDKLDKIFQRYNFDRARVQEMYKNIWDSLTQSEKNEGKAKELFLNKLFRYMPELEAVYKTQPELRQSITDKLISELGISEYQDKLIDDYLEAFKKSDVPDLINKKDIDDLMDAVYELNVVTDEASQNIKNLLIANVEEDFQTFLKTMKLEDEFASRIRFVVDNYMVIGDTKYTLKNLTQFLDALNKTGTPDEYMKVTTVLDYFGITVDNAAKIEQYASDVYKANSTKVYTERLYTTLSNLQREIKTWTTTQLNANLETLNSLMERVSWFRAMLGSEIERGNYSLFPNRPVVLVWIEELIEELETTPGLNHKYVNKTVRELKRFGRNHFGLNYNPSKELIELVTNSKKGAPLIEYDFSQIQNLFRHHKYKQPKITVKSTTDLYKHALGVSMSEQVHNMQTNLIDTQYRFTRELSEVTEQYMPAVNDVLNKVDNYMGNDKLATDYIDDIFEFKFPGVSEPDELFDFDFPIIKDMDDYFNLDAHDIVAFENAFENLHRRVKHWRSPDIYNKLNTYTQQFVDDLNTLFLKSRTPAYTQEFAALKAQMNNLYELQLRKQDTFKNIWTEISEYYERWDEDSKIWFAKLLDPKDSYFRDHLEYVAKIAEQKDMVHLADDIDHIVVSLKQLNPLADIDKTLRAKYTEILGNTQVDYVINLAYDLLYNSTLDITQAFDEEAISKLVKSYFDQVYFYSDGQHNYLRKAILEQAKNFGFPETEEYVLEIMDTLREDIRYVYKNYIEAMNEIATTSRVRVRVSPMVDASYLMERIKEISKDYLELYKYIDKPEIKNTLNNFIRNIGGTQATFPDEYLHFAEEIEGALQMTKVRKLTDDEAVAHSLRLKRTASTMNAYGVYDALKNSFRNIGTVNMDLTGTVDHFTVPVAGQYKTKKLKVVTRYFHASAIEDYLRQVGIADNIYDYSLVNDLGVTFKKVNRPDVFESTLNHDITAIYNNVADTTGFYDSFVSSYQDALNFIARSEKHAIMNTPEIESYRRALAVAYKGSDLPYAPRDPSSYFKNLSAEDVMAWHMVTKAKTFNQYVEARYSKELHKRLNLTRSESLTKPTAYSYTLGERIDYNEDPLSVYKSLEKKIHTTGFSDPLAFKEDIDFTAYTQYANLREYVVKDLRKWVKDPKTLLANSYNIQGHIQQSVDAWEWVRDADRLIKDTRRVSDMPLTPEQNLVLKSWGITGDTPMNDPKVLKYLVQERTNIRVESFKSWSAEEIRSFLDYDTQGYGIAFVVDDITENQYGKQTSLLKKFSKKQQREAGISITRPFKDAQHIYLIKKDKGEINPRQLIHRYFRPKYIFKEQQNKITSIFMHNKHYFEYDGTQIDPRTFTGDVFTHDELIKLFEVEEISKILGDDLERKTYSKAFATGVNSNFVPNTLVIGGPNATNELYSCIAQRVEDFKPVYRSTEIPRLVYGGNYTAINRANNAVKYLELFFNQDYYLGSDHFVKAFKDASDKEISEFFSKGKFVAMIAREADDGKPIIFKCMIDNRIDLDKAIEQGAVVVPHEVYRNAVLTINKRKLNNKLLNIYRRTIASTFKSIYLTHAGYVMRNWGDSAIYKNMASTEGMNSAWEVFKYQKKAADVWEWYCNIQQKMLDSTKASEEAIGTLNKRVVRQHLAKLTVEEQRLYCMVDIYAMSSASGGMSKALEEMLLQYNTLSSVDLEEWEKVWQQFLQQSKISPVYWVSQLNNQIEQTARLALFLKVVDESGDYAKGISTVLRTHFDYTLKEPGMKLLEDLFWFSTFPINNMYYYLNEGLTRNPDMFKMYMDMMEQSWNNNDITWDDVRRNNYYAYNAMRGNLRFKIKGRNFVLKTGSSVLDHLNILANPIGEAKERLNPFLSVLLGIEPVQELNPLAAGFNRFTQLGVGPGKSLIPSIYMELYPDNYIKRSYPKRTYDTSTWRRYPKRVYANSNQSYIKYKYITNAYSMRKRSRSWMWLTSTTAITPNWYHNNYRLYKTNNRLNRMQRKLKLPVYKT